MEELFTKTRPFTSPTSTWRTFPCAIACTEDSETGGHAEIAPEVVEGPERQHAQRLVSVGERTGDTAVASAEDHRLGIRRERNTREPSELEPGDGPHLGLDALSREERPHPLPEPRLPARELCAGIEQRHILHLCDPHAPDGRPSSPNRRASAERNVPIRS